MHTGAGWWCTGLALGTGSGDQELSQSGPVTELQCESEHHHEDIIIMLTR